MLWHKLPACWMLLQLLLCWLAVGGALGQDAQTGGGWQGDVGLGYTKTSGNTDTSSLALTADVSRPVARTATFGFKGDYFGATSEGETTANKGDAYARLSVAPWERMGYFVEMAVAFDQFKELEMRLAPGAGISYTVYKGGEGGLIAILGASWVKDFFTDETSEARAMLRLGDAFEWGISERSSFEQSFDIHFNFEDFSDYIFHAEAAVRADMTDHLFLKFAIIDDYDSEPLSESIKRNDLYLLTTLNYAF